MSVLPISFVERIKSSSLFDEKLITALDDEAPISIRLNTKKTLQAFNETQSVAWCENAFYLKERPSFTLDPLFHAGCYYPQEAGSMYIHSVLKTLDLPENPVALDLCAAPGGKSTLLASFLDNKGILISNEVIRTRANILAENITKWGYSNCFVTCNDPKDFKNVPNLFDLILIDAPCSGEGMFRKDIKARAEWSLENAQHCSLRQRRILADVWDSIKEDGYILYSTCTFNPAENEENVSWMLENFNCEVCELPLFEGMLKDSLNFGYYFTPGTTATEGFYCVLLQKKEVFKSNKKPKTNKTNFVSSQLFQSLIDEKIEHAFFEENDNYFAATPFSLDIYSIIDKSLFWIKRGVFVGTKQKKGFNPEIDLALNFSLRNTSETIELTKKEALQYLHGDTFPLEGTIGFKLLTYKSEPLGYIKHLGNRFNNLFPKEWRIRMNLPTDII